MNWGNSVVRVRAAVAAVAVAAVIGAGPSDGAADQPAGSQAGSQAGSLAGIGREHPGRPLEGVVPVPVPVAVPVEPVVAAPVIATTPDAGAPPGQGRAEAGSEVVLEVLPLGVGLTLMGAGLGFIGLRLRRDG